MIEISWWWYLILAAVIIALAVWNYFKYGFVGAIWGTIVGLAIWILTPPYLIDIESLIALPLIPILVALGIGVGLATVLAFACIYLVALVIVLLHFFIIP